MRFSSARCSATIFFSSFLRSAARFSAASWDWRLAASRSALAPFEVLQGRLVRLDVLGAGLGGDLRVLVGLELVAHAAAQDEPAGVDPALHVAQDGELLH